MKAPLNRKPLIGENTNADYFAVGKVKPDQFNKTAESFEIATAMLASKAKGGDLSAIKTQFGKVAQNCKSCHQQFRTK